MLAKIKAWFEAPDDTAPSLTSNEAATALMVEIMMADHDLDEREETLIVERLRHRADSGEGEDTIRALVEAAKRRQRETHDMFQFTKVINAEYSVDEKVELITDLWRTALADGAVDKHEEHLIRRINDLLHLHHSHFIQAKLTAQRE